MSTLKDIAEGAIVFNRASLALAKSQRLIASWLPPKTSEETLMTKTEDELDREESKAFLPVPELLGLGALVPPDGERQSGKSRHRGSKSEDKIWRQLMGKQPSALRSKCQSNSLSNHNGSMPTKYRLHDTSAQSESDDEVGRTAIRGRNVAAPMSRPHPDTPKAVTSQGISVMQTAKAAQKTSQTTASRKRSRSYLDEILMERSQKRKKKKQVEDRQS